MEYAESKSTNLIFITLVMLLLIFIYGGSKFVSNNFGPSIASSIPTEINTWSIKQKKVSLILQSKDAPKENIEVDGTALSVPVLVYHGITENGEDGISIGNFIEQMYALKAQGWNTVTIDDFDMFMLGEKGLQDRSFLLTFDDGRKDSYYYADPVLEKLNYNAVMFAITGSEGSYYLNDNELKEMSDSGRWEIESHTNRGHEKVKIENGEEGFFLTDRKWIENEERLETEREYVGRVENDLIAANTIISDEVGKAPNYFAFPYGEYGQHASNVEDSQSILENILKRYYKLVFYQAWTKGEYNFNYPSDSPFYIKRISVGDDWTSSKLVEILGKAEQKSTDYRDDLLKDNGWLNTWGLFSINDGVLNLKSDVNTTGALVYLDGTYLWNNYRFDVNARLVKGETISLLSYFVDGNDYYACNFGEGYVSITRNSKGEREQIIGRRDAFYPLGNEALASIEVKDNRISCYWFGNLAVYGDVDEVNAIQNGGIGLKVWSEELNNAELEVDSISVSSL